MSPLNIEVRLEGFIHQNGLKVGFKFRIILTTDWLVF